MNETSSELRGWTRRNFLKVAGVAGCAMLFPWLAYAAESDELNAKADELAATAASKQAEADEMKAKLDALQAQYNEALDRYNAANDAHDAAVAAMDAAQQRIDEASALIESTRNQLARRANSIYRQGSTSIIDVIFGSQNFDDFVTNWDSVERISQQDADLVQRNKDAKSEAEAAHAEYSRQEQIAADELANAKAAKEELETAQEALQKQYDEMNSDISAILAEAEQTRMSAEEAKKKEEEAAAAAQKALEEAQRRATASSSGSSTSYSSGSGSTSSTPGNVSGWVNPAPGKYITSGFGWRDLGDFHQGVDLSCSYEPVYAMAAGTCTWSGWFGTGGNAIVIDHGGGIVSWYLHNSSLCVQKGQQVSAGQQVSVSGNTGFSTGAHLHFQINVGCSNGINGTAVNPTTYFSW